MAAGQNKVAGKKGAQTTKTEVQTKETANSKKPLVTRHSQTGQQQGQHGGATQGSGKGRTATKK